MSSFRKKMGSGFAVVVYRNTAVALKYSAARRHKASSQLHPVSARICFKDNCGIAINYSKYQSQSHMFLPLYDGCHIILL